MVQVAGFWGLVVKPGKSYSQNVEASFVVTQAAFDSSIETENRSTVRVEVDGNEFALCSLIPGKVEQATLNHTFVEGEEITFYAHGENTIHLTGHYIFEDDAMDEDMMDGYDSMEDDEDISGEDIEGLSGEDYDSEDYDSEEEEDECCDHDGPKIQEINDEELQAIKRQVLDNKAKLANKKAKVEASSNSEDEEEDDSDEEDEEDTEFDSEMDEDVPSDLADSADEDDEEDEDEDDEEDDEDDSEDSEDDSEEESDEEVQVQIQPKKQQAAPQKQQPESTPAKKSAEAAKTATPQQQQQQKKVATPQPSQQQAKKVETPQANKKVDTPKDQAKKPETAQAKPAQQSKEQPKQQEKAKTAAATGPKTLNGGLVIEDIKSGNSDRKAKPGSTVMVRYIGRLPNGKVFDSNTDGRPFKFKIGRGEVIKGWDMGIAGMAVGGERKLIIPAPLAYGERGAPPSIPRNATLHFEVKLLEIQ